MAAGPMKMRATLGPGYTDVRVLMTHPMETGQRKDADGKLVPMHFIQNLTVKVNGKTVIEAQISQAVSRNPVFSFRLKGGAKGDKIEVSWLDNQGESNRSKPRSREARCALALAARRARRAARWRRTPKKEIQRYRQMVGEGSPAELFELEGEALWKKPQGPKNVSLEKCDLGRGPGVLKGAYAAPAALLQGRRPGHGPRDAPAALHDRPCRAAAARRRPQRVFGNADRPSEMESLSAYVAAQSRGMKIGARACRHPKEKSVLRARPQRSSSIAPAPGTSPAPAATARKASASACRSCRCSTSRRRAQPVVASWPAYRVSTSQFITHAVAHERLLPPDAHARAGLRLRGHRGADPLPHRHGQGRDLSRAREQAMKRVASVSCVALLRCPPRACASRRRKTWRSSCSATSTRAARRAWTACVQDGVQRVCTETHNQPPAELAKSLEADQMKTIAFPEGSLIGDWKRGERIAQSGRGMTWTDTAGRRRTAAAATTATSSRRRRSRTARIGPSLAGFGKKRGSGPEVQRYVYGKIYNAKAYNVCSQMPRLGHSGTLTEQQIKDLVGLLLDPASPVNQ